MLQIRLKTGIDREQFRHSGQKRLKKAARVWQGLQKGMRKNIMVECFLQVYFLNQYKHWFDNNLKCEDIGANNVAVSVVQ